MGPQWDTHKYMYDVPILYQGFHDLTLHPALIMSLHLDE